MVDLVRVQQRWAAVRRPSLYDCVSVTLSRTLALSLLAMFLPLTSSSLITAVFIEGRAFLPRGSFVSRAPHWPHTTLGAGTRGNGNQSVYAYFAGGSRHEWMDARTADSETATARKSEVASWFLSACWMSRFRFSISPVELRRRQQI
jgi:hypothetical protein